MFIRALIVTLAVYLGAGTANAAVTSKEVDEIYTKLAEVNHIDAPPLYLMRDNSINGFSDGVKIVITSGAMKQLNKPEMALLLAHELAHHHFKDAYQVFTYGTFLEDRADRFGSRWAKNIGYNECQQAGLFVKFIMKYGNDRKPGDTHSSNGKRFWEVYKYCRGK